MPGERVSPFFFASGESEEAKVRIAGRLFIPFDRPRHFGLELSAPLQPPPDPPPPLPGGFSLLSDGYEAECRLGDGSRLKLLLASEAQASAPDLEERQILPRPVAACRELFDQLSSSLTRASNRGLFRDACHCLSSLLLSPQPELRIAAAEELMSAGCWSERRQLYGMLRREFGLPQRPSKPGPPLQDPADDRGRLRLMRALIGHGGRLPKGALERLVANASPPIRRRIMHDVLMRHPSLFGPVAEYFLDEKDPLLAARAANLGCLLGDARAGATFERLFSAKGEAAQLAALLHAPACLRGAAPGAGGPAGERPLPALLTWRIRRDGAGRGRSEPLLEWLAHPCPIVRFLAGDELARRGGAPGEAILALAERERDENLKERLRALAAGRPLPTWPVIQLWLEDVPVPTP